MSEVNFNNRTLYHGDNLEFLRGLNSGTVHLIATDPPFKKGRDFHATPDSLSKGASFQDRWSWRDDVHDEWLDSIQEDYDEIWRVIDASRHSYGSDIAAFLCFMAVRLIEMHRVLRDDGSIYLHCDPTASHYLKMLMDAVFGAKSFRNEIVWHYDNRLQRAAGGFAGLHDLLLVYAKSNRVISNPIYDENWQPSNTQRRRLSRGFEVRKGDLIIYDETKFQASGIDESSYNRVYRSSANRPPIGDVWAVPILNPMAKERTGYPTQKPLALYERIIKASSNPGDIVLDPFSGCATTPIAAERLGRQWVGMDLWDKAHKVVLQRLESEGLAVPEGNGSNLITFGDVYYCTEPPKRTDNGNSIQILTTPTGRREQRYLKPRTQHGRLLADVGARCQGCGNDYSFDPRVLEVDHKMPRADGGTDAYENLTLLCPPCNKLKRDRLTLTGLQAENRRLGYMNTEGEKFIVHGEARRRARRRRR